MATASQVLLLANGVCTEYIPKITSVWDDCGFSTTDRNREGEALVQEISNILQAKLHAFDRLRMEYKEKIRILSQQIESLSVQLGEKPDLAVNVPFTQRLSVLSDIQKKLSMKADENFKIFRELYEKHRTLIAELDDPKRPVPPIFTRETVPDLSSAGIHTLAAKNTNLAIEIDEVKRKIRATTAEIRKLWDELMVPIESCTSRLDQFVLSNYTGAPSDASRIVLGVRTLHALELKLSLLTTDRDRRKSDMAMFLEKIKRMWDQLSVPEAERAAFLATLSRTPKDYETLNREYSRLQKIMQLQLRKVIEKRKDRIRELMNELYFGDAQREKLAPLLESAEYGDELAAAVEAEIQRLEALLQRMEPLLKMILRREWFKQEMKEFEKSASDPNRLFQDSGRLLQEEKFRKLVAKEFPKLTEDLRALLQNWNADGGEPFSFKGEPYLETMAREQEMPNFGLLHLKLLTGSPKKASTVTRSAPVAAAAKAKSPSVVPTTTSKPAANHSPAAGTAAKVSPAPRVAALKPSAKANTPTIAASPAGKSALPSRAAPKLPSPVVPAAKHKPAK